jgi:hypothetical protein
VAMTYSVTSRALLRKIASDEQQGDTMSTKHDDDSAESSRGGLAMVRGSRRRLRQL